jgi:2-oxoglutarate ferredoxin oxidoreductase subunit gamma
VKQLEVTFAGFGGQGIMTAGKLLAYAGINESKKVVWIPSYGPEMRGGTAYCTVVVSDVLIGSPIINVPWCICVFNRPSFDKFESHVKPGGLFIVNSSLIDVKSERTDVTQILIPANEMAMKAGNAKAANLAVLGALLGASDIVSPDSLRQAIGEKLAKKKEFLEMNYKVFEEGYQFAQQCVGQEKKA